MGNPMAMARESKCTRVAPHADKGRLLESDTTSAGADGQRQAVIDQRAIQLGPAVEADRAVIDCKPTGR